MADEDPPDQKTRVMPAVQRRVQGVRDSARRGLGRILPERLRKTIAGQRTPVMVAAGVAIAILAIGGSMKLASSLIGGDSTKAALPSDRQLASTESSWVVGQGSIFSDPLFHALALRAHALGEERFESREQMLAAIARAKEEARKRKEEEARRRALEARKRALEERRRALARFRAAQERAERERQRQLALQRRREAEHRRRLAEFERLRRVNPGPECRLGSVRADYQCMRGKTPLADGSD